MVNGKASKLTEVKNGIPHGSILEPILFVIFINYLPDVVSSSVKIFAGAINNYPAINTTVNSEALD